MEYTAGHRLDDGNLIKGLSGEMNRLRIFVRRQLGPID
jgi:hypothetical protein